MKVCHILPPAVVGYPGIELQDQHLILPSLVRGSARYRAFYRDRAGIGWITLDNGVAEDEQVSFELLLDMARVMNVQEVVLPDTLQDSDQTLKGLIEVYTKAFDNRNRFRFMFVPQGKTISEVIHCAEQAENMCPGVINTFGIPRHTLGFATSARAQIAFALRDRFPGKELHLLGTHPDDPMELFHYATDYHRAGVRSVDTSMAWNATLMGVDLKTDLRVNPYRTVKRQGIEDFAKASFDHADPYYVKLLQHNMEAIDQWVK